MSLSTSRLAGFFNNRPVGSATHVLNPPVNQRMISCSQPFESGKQNGSILIGGKLFNSNDLIKFKEALSRLPQIKMNEVKEDSFFENSFEILPGEAVFLDQNSDLNSSISRQTSTCFQILIINHDQSEFYHTHVNYHYRIDWVQILSNFESKNLTVTLIGGVSVDPKSMRNFETLFSPLLELECDYNISFDRQMIFDDYTQQYSTKPAKYPDIAIDRHGDFYDIRKHSELLDIQFPLKALDIREVRSFESEFRNCFQLQGYNQAIGKSDLIQYRNGKVFKYGLRLKIEFDNISKIIIKQLLDHPASLASYLKSCLNAKFPEMLREVIPDFEKKRTDYKDKLSQFFVFIHSYEPQPDFTIRHWLSPPKYDPLNFKA